jgi:hypothetical protein
MLIILEIQKIVRLSSNGNFSLFGNLNNCIMGWSLDNIKTEIIIDQTSLKLIGAHLYDHFLNN